MAAAVGVVGGDEGAVGVEDVGDDGVEVRHERLGNGGDVVDGLFAQTEGGVVVVAAGMLDEEQAGTDGLAFGGGADDVRVEEGLEIVVAMVLQTFWGEDGIDVGEGFQPVAAGLVVDNADALGAVGDGDEVEAVDGAADVEPLAGGGYAVRHLDQTLEAEDGEGRQATVDLEELMDVVDDDLAVDEL